jgi:hypothetical protein
VIYLREHETKTTPLGHQSMHPGWTAHGPDVCMGILTDCGKLGRHNLRNRAPEIGDGEKV